ncbi:MAG: PHB depolymerase family esterase [Dokdonella sp.]
MHVSHRIAGNDRRRYWIFPRALLGIAATTWIGTCAKADCEDLFGDGFDSHALSAVVASSATLQTTDGMAHTFFYRIPIKAAPFHGHPVLIWLHGDGGSGNGYGSGFYPFTDADSAILVTPSGINQTWTHAAADLPGMPQDSQFISNLIDTLIANGVDGERVDPNRIYLGGESRGAFMPYFLLQRPSTKMKFAAVAVNAGLLYCQAGDADCDTDSSSPLHHSAATPILHLHGTNDTSVEPPPTATFHNPVDWNIDWRVFFPMNLWAKQNACFGGDNSTGNDSGVLQETYIANGHTAQRYDLSAWGASCSKYQLILVIDGGHVIGNQSGRVWSFLKGYCHAGG